MVKRYKIIIKRKAVKALEKIYEYISEELYEEKTAKNLMKQIENRIEYLKYVPEIYAKIEKYDEFKRQYRKIVIKNFIVLYIVNEESKVVIIRNVFYEKRNYL